MKFRFIVLTEEGNLYGVNNIKRAESIALHELVYDNATGQYIHNNQPIEEYPGEIPNS